MPVAIALLGEQVLREVAKPLEPSSAIASDLADELLREVDVLGGMGLAAPQIFQPWRAVVIASKPNGRYPKAPFMEPFVMFNPDITAIGDAQEKAWEGCLSVPAMRGFVPRFKRIHVRYQTPDFEQRELELDGFLARVVQHECDHLDGLLFVDRLESTRDLVAETVWRRMFPE